jgi:transposase
VRRPDLGTEIRTFTTLKDITEFLLDQGAQYKGLFEDYSQWLGSLLRSCEDAHKNEDWYQKSAALQKNLKGQPKKAPEQKAAGKKNDGKGKNDESSVWIQSGNILLSSTEQGQVEIMFEAIEKINDKILELEKFKAAVQQLERIGLGKTVNYIVYIEDDIPKKIVIRAKNTSNEEVFKFATEFSVPAVFNTLSSG